MPNINGIKTSAASNRPFVNTPTRSNVAVPKKATTKKVTTSFAKLTLQTPDETVRELLKTYLQGQIPAIELTCAYLVDREFELMSSKPRDASATYPQNEEQFLRKIPDCYGDDTTKEKACELIGEYIAQDPQNAVARAEKIQLKFINSAAMHLFLGNLFLPQELQTGKVSAHIPPDFKVAVDFLKHAKRLNPITNENVLSDLYDRCFKWFSYFFKMQEDTKAVSFGLGAFLIAPCATIAKELGHCYFNLSEYANALNYYLKAKELGDRSWKLQRDIGEAYLNMDDMVLAGLHLRPLLRIDQAKDDHEVRESYGEVLRRQGFFFEAQGHLEAAVKADPSCYTAKTCLASCKRCLGLRLEALTLFLEVPKANREGVFTNRELQAVLEDAKVHGSADELLYFGSLLRNNGEPLRAHDLLTFALKKFPDNAAIVAELSKIG